MPVETPTQTEFLQAITALNNRVQALEESQMPEEIKTEITNIMNSAATILAWLLGGEQ